MMKSKISIIAVLLLSVPALLQAQKVYTLSECRHMALSNNVKIRNSKLAIDQSKEQEKEAFTKYFPTVSATGTYFRSNYLVKQDLSMSSDSDTEDQDE